MTGRSGAPRPTSNQDALDLIEADLDYANLRGTGLSKSGLTDSVGSFAGMNQPKSIESQRTSVSRG